MLALISPAKTLDYRRPLRLADPEALKGFDSDGYRWDPRNSDENRWRFARS